MDDSNLGGKEKLGMDWEQERKDTMQRYIRMRVIFLFLLQINFIPH